MPSGKVRVAGVAGRQFGRISRAQLMASDIDSQTVRRWVAAAYLHPVLPRVYAVGHAGRSIEGDLAAALLYAGPGAQLSHATAVWWWGLDDRRPTTIEVSTPRRPRSRRGIRVHPRRTLVRVWHRGLPVTTVAQTLLDYAATAPLTRLRRALANAEFHRLLELPEIEAALRRGRPGSARLRAALLRHQPRLAQSRSDLEAAMLGLCEQGGLPLPEVNARIHGWEVDFVWPEWGVVVEVDGWGNHRSAAQIRRDHRKDQALRAHGLRVLRYSDEQVQREAAAVLAELRAASHPALSA